MPAPPLRFGADSTALVQSATSDMESGTYTSMPWTAADALGLLAAKVCVQLGESTIPSAAGGRQVSACRATGRRVVVCAVCSDRVARAGMRMGGPDMVEEIKN
ncbi:hypothetical protein GCM10009850_115160 [Nonomuraea monospora]|uniref:Uncharacterized protein n=1 Tax=Nonomuraea monospora TaxID=568818 RepID=A0ABP5PWC0_9ACTN